MRSNDSQELPSIKGLTKETGTKTPESTPALKLKKSISQAIQEGIELADSNSPESPTQEAHKPSEERIYRYSLEPTTDSWRTENQEIIFQNLRFLGLPLQNFSEDNPYSELAKSTDNISLLNTLVQQWSNNILDNTSNTADNKPIDLPDDFFFPNYPKLPAGLREYCLQMIRDEILLFDGIKILPGWQIEPDTNPENTNQYKLIPSTQSEINLGNLTHEMTEVYSYDWEVFQIETITNTPENPQGPHVLLIHGMCHEASCFTKTLRELEQQGIKATAISLPLHGLSGGYKEINHWTIEKYLNVLIQIIESMDEKVVIAGHSMGAYLAQALSYYAEKEIDQLHTTNIIGSIGIAQATPKVVTSASINTALHPKRAVPFTVALGSANLRHLFSTPALYQKLFLQEGYSQEFINAAMNKLQPESLLAYIQMIYGAQLPKRPPAYHRNRKKRGQEPIPRLFIGASNDFFIPPKKLEKAAKAHNAESIILEGPHSIIWDKSADIATLINQFCKQTQ